jgi:hypothetical protein
MKTAKKKNNDQWVDHKESKVSGSTRIDRTISTEVVLTFVASLLLASLSPISEMALLCGPDKAKNQLKP